MTRPEQDFQMQVARYLDLALPGDAFWTAFPAGGGGKIRGAILKGMGLKAGVPDILIVHEGRALFLELKAGRGRISPAQAKTHGDLWEAGSPVAVCRSLSEVQMVLLRWAIPLKARAA